MGAVLGVVGDQAVDGELGLISHSPNGFFFIALGRMMAAVRIMITMMILKLCAAGKMCKIRRNHCFIPRDIMCVWVAYCSQRQGTDYQECTLDFTEWCARSAHWYLILTNEQVSKLNSVSGSHCDPLSLTKA